MYGQVPCCNLTQHEDDGEERVPVEGQGTQQEHADTQQPASIYEQAPRNQAQERHPYRGDAQCSAVFSDFNFSQSRPALSNN